MGGSRGVTRGRPRGQSASSTNSQDALLVYIHGIGRQGDPADLKLEWDLALFGRDMGPRSRMAYWADILHGDANSARARKSARAPGGSIDPGRALADVGIDPENREALRFATALLADVGVAEGRGASKKVLPLPGFLRRPISRALLEALVGDSAAYFFRPAIRRRIKQRLGDQLPDDGTPVVLVSHSQGTVVSFEVLADVAGRHSIPLLVTLGSPLGIREIQDHLAPELRVPGGIVRWENFADPLDPVALDKGLGNDFDPSGFIRDGLLVNERTRRLPGFNPHSSIGYLAHPKVRAAVHRAARFDSMTRFVVARDVAESLASESRHSVLIEILEPAYGALDETREETARHEREIEKGRTSLADRIHRAAVALEAVVADPKQARIDELRRFVAAHLTPAEIRRVAAEHRDLRVYAVWRSATKRALTDRSVAVVKADAALASYGATGRGITWAVLDTGIRADHPHFQTYANVREVWDCTKQGPPKPIKAHRDPDGHGTHVAGIIAGAAPEGHGRRIRGLAPQASLVVYKVLNEKGEGEDAWIIKALDHISEKNDNNAGLAIDGINLSLGGPFDATVYGCGHSPICVELRRLWRQGVVVCVACGNEGQIQIETTDGAFDLNTQISIGDPANLEDCIAVGSVNADRPSLYGISYFSSRGPTADGRLKPDVVAPGERITSCNSNYTDKKGDGLYRTESGTSMAAPHVSGLLAAFLSVRREFRGRPDEVKEILHRTCIDIGRDRYNQGHGIPNLMKMLLEV